MTNTEQVVTLKRLQEKMTGLIQVMAHASAELNQPLEAVSDRAFELLLDRRDAMMVNIVWAAKYAGQIAKTFVAIAGESSQATRCLAICENVLSQYAPKSTVAAAGVLVSNSSAASTVSGFNVQ